MFRCPFLSTDAEGNYTCRVYQYRFNACRQFPLRPAVRAGTIALEELPLLLSQELLAG